MDNAGKLQTPFIIYMTRINKPLALLYITLAVTRVVSIRGRLVKRQFPISNFLPVFVICIAGLIPSISSGGVSTYDLTSNFSTSSNPNGVWSYEESNVPITQKQTPSYGAGWGYYGNEDASILQLNTAPTGWNDAQAGDVVMHAPSVPYGGPTAYLDIKWTSPTNGAISITGRAWDDEFNAGRDANWWLSVGGTTKASRGSVYGLHRSDTAAQFSSNLLPGNSLTGISVTKGEVVTFAVAADTYYGHFVGVQEVITLTVQATPVITWANPAPITYGTALSSNQLNATANVLGSFAYNPTNGAVLNAGTNLLSVIFTPTDTVDYISVAKTVTLVVSREPLTVTAANATRAYGQPNPPFTGTITGVTNRDNITATYSCSATPGSVPNTYPIVPRLLDPNGRLSNYQTNLINGTLTVTNAALPDLQVVSVSMPPEAWTGRPFDVGWVVTNAGLSVATGP